MPLFTDQISRSVPIPEKPESIISLVPSQTELLSFLGLHKEVSGITKFCVHPEQWQRSKTRIGGTKDLNIPLIRSLKPDLIIAGKEENVEEQVAALWNEFPTWVSDVTNIDTALRMISSVGDITGTAQKAAKLAQNIQTLFEKMPRQGSGIRAAYLIWRKPYMTVGGDTFIHNMMQAAGFNNVFGDRLRYPVVTVDDIRASGCKLVLLSSEPYPFKERHVAELETLVPGVKPVLADGEMFSWYGSRMLYAPAYFSKLRAQLAPLLEV